MTIFKKIGSYFLKEYNEADFVRYKRAQFILILSILLATLMVALSLIATTYPKDRFIETIIPATLLIFINLMLKGKSLHFL